MRIALQNMRHRFLGNRTFEDLGMAVKVALRADFIWRSQWLKPIQEGIPHTGWHSGLYVGTLTVNSKLATNLTMAIDNEVDETSEAVLKLVFGNNGGNLSKRFYEYWNKVNIWNFIINMNTNINKKWLN